MSLRKKLKDLEFGFNNLYLHPDIEKLHRKLHKCVTNLVDRILVLEHRAEHHVHPEDPTIPKILKRLKTLERQVQCGINGHSFELQCMDVLDDVADRTKCSTTGVFVCAICGAETARKLTADEIKAAKKLGF